MGPATPDLVPALLYRMGAERTAALAQRVGDPLAEISSNIERSAVAWAGLDKAGVVALGGAIPEGESTYAYVWQFVTDGVRANRRGYLAMSRVAAQEALARFRLLVTLIETTNPVALRHCRQLGFEIQPASWINGLHVHVCALRRTPPVQSGTIH